ncbi:MAG: hypothetical protein FWD22_04700 [Treponema sp.]|nr:hypothetical protein [Treponema sp.]
MRIIFAILTLAAVAALVGCGGTPVAANRHGNVPPVMKDFRPAEHNSTVTEFENKDFLPSMQLDGSVIVSRINGVNIRIMPMTDGRTKGAVRPDEEINDLIRQNEAILRTDPQNFDACIMLAGLYIDRNRPGDAANAIRYSNMALAINKDDPQAMFARGVSHTEAGNNASALNDFQAAVRLNVQSAKSATYMMGMIYSREWEQLRTANRPAEAAAKLEAAIESFEMVVALDPNFIDTAEILQVLYGRR